MNPLIKDPSSQTKSGTALPVMEHFYTLQGEGVFTGQAAYFIRLGGCDVGCSWCDVKESWDAAAHPIWQIQDLVELTTSHPAPIVVITGGEPAMHNLEPLTSALHKANKRTHIETSGAHPLSGKWHWVCFSPKKFKSPVDSIYQQADELKIIVYNKHDFKWAEQHAAKLQKKCRLLLQPEWSKKEEMMPLIIDYVKAHPEWQISLQTHKYMNIP